MTLYLTKLYFEKFRCDRGFEIQFLCLKLEIKMKSFLSINQKLNILQKLYLCPVSKGELTKAKNFTDSNKEME